MNKVLVIDKLSSSKSQSKMLSPSATSYNPESKVWSGPPEDFDANVALGTYFFNYLKSEIAKYPNKVIQLHDETDEKTTVLDMFEQSVRLAVCLTELGLRVGDIVVVVSPHLPLLLPVSIALQYLGVIVTYLNESTAEQTNDENDTPLKRLNPRYVICESLFADTVVIRDVSVDNILTFTKLEELLAKNENVGEHFVPVTINEPRNVTSMILATSGTTGKAKLICLSHALILSQCMRWHNYPNEGIVYNFSGINWITGIDGVFGDFIRGKLRIITSIRSTPERFIAIITKYRVTEMFVDPSALALIVQLLEKTQQILNSVKIILIGGTVVSDQLRKSVEQYVPNGNVVIIYGMTEVGGMLSVGFKPKGTSAGLLVRGIQIKIRNSNNENLGPNEQGEICTKSPHGYLNYFKNHPPREEQCDKDGWYLTKDIGYFDEEDYLFVVGRKQDILLYINHLLNPVDIEKALEAHKGVLHACVVGVRVPVYFDIPTAIVERTEGSTVTEDELHDFIEDKIPSGHHRLRGGIFFIDKLPRTITGKIMRLEVKTLAFKLYFEGKTSIHPNR